MDLSMNPLDIKKFVHQWPVVGVIPVFASGKRRMDLRNSKTYCLLWTIDLLTYLRFMNSRPHL